MAGVVAALAMGVVGCTSIIGGNPQADTSEAPAYRSSVSASVSASEATSSIRETQRQQSMTTQAVRGACGRFASSSSDAVDVVRAQRRRRNHHEPSRARHFRGHLRVL